MELPELWKTVLERGIRKFGNNAQELKTIEEMAELTQAIVKVQQKSLNGNPYTVDNLVEEIADVELCLEQLKMIHKIRRF